MHVVHVIANNSSVPYLNWFADRLSNYPGVKFTVIALYHEKPALMEDMKQRGCDCYWLKYDPAQRKRGMIRAFFKLYRLFKKLKPDAVNTHLFDDSLPGLLAARMAGIKKRIIRKQETGYHWYFTPQWVRADRFNNYNATDIIAISEDSKKFLLEKEKAPAGKIHLIPNGMPVNDFISAREEDKNHLIEKYGLRDKIVIGTVARYIEWKGYRYIIEAAKILTVKYKNLRFLFAGEGDQRAELEELTEKYGLTEYIVFTGWIDRKYIPALYGVMDLYVHAAFMEPFGYVLTEAMAMGVPIVTCKSGVAADALEHKVTCYFTGFKDPESIAAGIEWILENPAQREAMKEKLKKLVAEKYNIENMLEGHIRVYSGLY